MITFLLVLITIKSLVTVYAVLRAAGDMANELPGMLEFDGGGKNRISHIPLLPIVQSKN